MDCLADLWKLAEMQDLDLWIFYQVRKFFLIEIPGLVGFASYAGVQKIVDPRLVSSQGVSVDLKFQ